MKCDEAEQVGRLVLGENARAIPAALRRLKMQSWPQDTAVSGSEPTVFCTPMSMPLTHGYCGANTQREVHLDRPLLG